MFAPWCLCPGPRQRMEPNTGWLSRENEGNREANPHVSLCWAFSFREGDSSEASKYPTNFPNIQVIRFIFDSPVTTIMFLLTQTMVQRPHSSPPFGSSYLNFLPILFKVNMRFQKYEHQLLRWKVSHKIVLIKCSEKWCGGRILLPDLPQFRGSGTISLITTLIQRERKTAGHSREFQGPRSSWLKTTIRQWGEMWKQVPGTRPML